MPPTLSGALHSGSGNEDPDRTTEMKCVLCDILIYHPTPYGKPTLNPVIRQAYGSAASVQVTMTAGEQAWDWGAGETTGFHVCPKCFEQELIPWFEARGALPIVKSWLT